MALPSTGSISMSQVRTELGLSGTISLGQSQVRALAGIPSGPISLSDFLGKSALLLSAVVTSGYVPESGDSKINIAELRGFWARVRDSINTASQPIGAISPNTVAGQTVMAVGETSIDALESYSEFVFAVNGQSVALDFFNFIRVKDGSTVVGEFTRNDSHPDGEGVGVRKNYYIDINTPVPVTEWAWSLPLNNRGQIFPTSGTRTIEIG